MMPRQLAKTTSIPDSVRVGASRFGTRVLPETASTRSWPDLICWVYSRTPDAAKSTSLREDGRQQLAAAVMRTCR